MLKKAGAVAAIAAGLMMIGSPAFAGEPADHDWGHDDHGHAGDTHQWNSDGLLSVLNNNNVNVPVGVCNNNVAVLAAVVPVASPSVTQNCASAVTVDGDDGNVGGNDVG
ncbi:hypothetical protein ABZ816_05355 [Actinosynnema sp. NPDC047251]|uniref:Putative secreted protein n=1 Tax=Saccharothrix espanaensis (strain ATCC 51144 / DSM 44229 / JCM 9112 / NBRC 15066 / NRRL 15764) TaxID=1179773 RepID=K0JQX8_SACES|nr:hypothetical protein [Saccharothrix espanaensis]CCH28121.1 putative secreted protein [Saccharothrix espanaensis DSM 44229]